MLFRQNRNRLGERKGCHGSVWSPVMLLRTMAQRPDLGDGDLAESFLFVSREKQATSRGSLLSISWVCENLGTE